MRTLSNSEKEKLLSLQVPITYSKDYNLEEILQYIPKYVYSYKHSSFFHLNILFNNCVPEISYINKATGMKLPLDDRDTVRTSTLFDGLYEMLCVLARLRYLDNDAYMDNSEYDYGHNVPSYVNRDECDF